mmetsp:Transcript_2226/g.8552  ORF Transcript_2226/g.8552 Transcript_2226/m.8552 type:complete len:318 (+) Transcript_2226:1320-2273(+)
MSTVCGAASSAARCFARSSSTSAFLAVSKSCSACFAASSASIAARFFRSSSATAALSFATAAAFSATSSRSLSFSRSLFCCAMASKSLHSASGIAALPFPASFPPTGSPPIGPAGVARFAHPAWLVTVTAALLAFCFSATPSSTGRDDDTSTAEAPPAPAFAAAGPPPPPFPFAPFAPVLSFGLLPPPSALSYESESESDDDPLSLLEDVASESAPFTAPGADTEGVLPLLGAAAGAEAVPTPKLASTCISSRSASCSIRCASRSISSWVCFFFLGFKHDRTNLSSFQSVTESSSSMLISIKSSWFPPSSVCRSATI